MDEYKNKRIMFWGTIALVLIILGIGSYDYVEFQQESVYVMGGHYIVATGEKEKSKKRSEINDIEKYFRPSKLPALNNLPVADEIISKNIDYNKIDFPKGFYEDPETVVLEYFSLLREAAYLVDGKNAGCGSLGTGQNPYKITYQMLTKEYQKKNSFQKYKESFANILHISLVKLHEVPSDSAHPNQKKFFYEIEVIRGNEDNVPSFSYYYGFIYLEKQGEGYKISDIDIRGENYLCAPYHGWSYDAEASVSIRYGDWCNLIKKMGKVETDGYVKKIYFDGADGKEYVIVFFVLTNDNDFEVEQYVKNDQGNWELIHLNPEDCLKNKKQ